MIMQTFKKLCCSCKEEKEPHNFHNNKKSIDGKQAKCKQCTNEHSSKYRKENREKLQAKRNYNCKKYQAQQLVRTAVKKGRLIKTTCEQCDSLEKTIGHHDDYDKPLDVRWLCCACHGAWHSEHGEARNAR